MRDLNTYQGLRKLQDELLAKKGEAIHALVAAEKTKRELDVAVSTVELLMLGMSIREGTLASDDALQHALGIAAHGTKLKAGDMDLVTGHVIPELPGWCGSNKDME